MPTDAEKANKWYTEAQYECNQAFETFYRFRRKIDGLGLLEELKELVDITPDDNVEPSPELVQKYILLFERIAAVTNVKFAIKVISVDVQMGPYNDKMQGKLALAKVGTILLRHLASKYNLPITIEGGGTDIEAALERVREAITLTVKQ